MVGSVTYVLGEEETGDLLPLDVYALHCCWELQVNKDPRAGGGFLGDRYTKGKEAEVRSGTEFGVYLNQAFSLPKFAEAIPTNP